MLIYHNTQKQDEMNIYDNRKMERLRVMLSLNKETPNEQTLTTLRRMNNT